MCPLQTPIGIYIHTTHGPKYPKNDAKREPARANSIQSVFWHYNQRSHWSLIFTQLNSRFVLLLCSTLYMPYIHFCAAHIKQKCKCVHTQTKVRVFIIFWFDVGFHTVSNTTLIYKIKKIEFLVDSLFGFAEKFFLAHSDLYLYVLRIHVH